MRRTDQRFEQFGPFTGTAPVQRSYNTPTTLGFHPTQVNLASRNMVVVGQRGAGKTNLLQTVIANAVCSPDAAVTVVDTEMGALAVPWLHGSPDHLVLDRVAISDADALSVFTHHIELAKARKQHFFQSMLAHNADRVPTGNGRDFCSTCGEIHPPHLVVVVNDIGELSTDAQQKLELLFRLARPFGISVAAGVLRATSDVLPSRLLRATSVQVGLRMSQPDAEAAYLFGVGDFVTVQLPGQGLIRVDGGQVQPFYPILTSLSDIKETAAFAATIRPELDEQEAGVGGEAYERRWDAPGVYEWVKRVRGI